jgi:hypothetical protein
MSDNAGRLDWLEYWKRRDAWTVREFAQLCCGWNPTEYKIHNQNAYNDAIESINRAVRVRALRTIDNLAWPATGAEQMYDSVPAFRPIEVCEWAKKHYGTTFPEALSFQISDDPDSRERRSLLRIIAALAKLAGIPVDQTSKAAGIIAVETKSLEAPVGEKTIETHLKRIPEALEPRERWK